MQIDSNKLNSLLKDKRLDEARALIESFLKSSSSENIDNDISIDLAVEYMKIMNSINEEYVEEVSKLLSELKASKTS